MADQARPGRRRPRVKTMREPDPGGAPAPSAPVEPLSGGQEASYARSMGLGFALGCAGFTAMLLVLGGGGAALWWGMSSTPSPLPASVEKGGQGGVEAEEGPVAPVEAPPSVSGLPCLTEGLQSFKCSSGAECRRSGGQASRDGDDALSFEYFHEGCRRGDMASCLYLGFLHDSGKLGGEDPGRATACYRDACESGSKKACYNYGFMLEKGASDRESQVEAWRLYDSSCGQGHSPACKRRARLCQSKGICGPG